MAQQQITNKDIFNEVFNSSLMAPAILRDALTHYIELLEKSGKEGFEGGIINYDGWLAEAKRVKSLIDQGYSKL